MAVAALVVSIVAAVFTGWSLLYTKPLRTDLRDGEAGLDRS
jgi:hypothetical protein